MLKISKYHLPHKQHIGLILLIIAGFLGNYCRWTLFFNIDFLFGSIAVWIVVCLYGVGWGTLAGFIAGLCTYAIWHHPYTAFTFTAEALFVGWMFHRRQQNNIVLLDGLFWLVIGMPLVWLFYAVILQLEPTQALIILFKQPVNGIFNALIASLLLTHSPIHRWVNRPPAISTLSLQQTLFNLLVAFVLFPTLILIVLASRQVVDDIQNTMRLNLNYASRYLTVEVERWYERRLTAVNKLAELASLQNTVLQQNAAFVSRSFPEFRHIHVLDESGGKILDLDRNPIPSSAFNESKYFEQLRRSLKPFISPVLLSGNSSSPVTLLGVPIMRDGKLAGAIFSEIDLSRLTMFLQPNLGEESLQVVLVDQQQTVAASTKLEWIGKQEFNWRKDGKVNQIGAQAYHWLPTSGSSLVMEWQNSLFVKESAISQTIPWTLIVQIAATPQANLIQQVHTRNMALLLLILGLALILATLVSRQLVQPLSQLAEVTTNLPNKLLEQEPINWVQSRVTELALLVKNFRSMAASLQQKFGEINQVNQSLVEAQHVARLGSWELNIVTGEVIWSAELFQIFGFDPMKPAPNYELQRQIFEPNDWQQLDRMVNQAIQFGDPYEIDLKTIRADGSSGYVFAKGQLIPNPTGQVTRLVGIAMDISDRKLAEEKLRQTATQLEVANKELESFSYSVSHDLRAPLRAISGFSRMLQEDYGEQLDQEGNRYISIVRENAKRMGELIDDLLNLSRLNRREISWQKVSQNETIQQVLMDLTLECADRQIEFAIAELPICQADPSLLKQVWLNLLSNAIKYTRYKSPAYIEVGYTVVDHEGVYFIRDNGAGFDMQYADQLFGVFQRLHRPQDFEGTGIGLAIVQRIVQRHGGRIWAEAAVDRGATFYFTLPDK